MPAWRCQYTNSRFEIIWLTDLQAGTYYSSFTATSAATPSVNMIAAKRGVKVPSTKMGFRMAACVIAELRGTVFSCLPSTSSRPPSLTNISNLGPYRDLSRWKRGWLGRSKGKLSLMPFYADFFPAALVALLSLLLLLLALRYFTALARHAIKYPSWASRQAQCEQESECGVVGKARERQWRRSCGWKTGQRS
jgi:hypothetical protein